MKCPMCKSRDIIDIKKPKEIPFDLSENKKIMVYPQNKCLNCGHEFNTLINHNKSEVLI